MSPLARRPPSSVRVAFPRQIDADVGGNSNESITSMRYVGNDIVGLAQDFHFHASEQSSSPAEEI